MTDLKPCPFCGSIASLSYNTHDSYICYEVSCMNIRCSATIRTPPYLIYRADSAFVVKAWNKRANDE